MNWKLGGCVDMTEKRFVWKIDETGHGHIYDRITRKRVGQHKRTVEPLNQLWEENQELRKDNDIKFWKHECIREANTNSVFAFELGKAIEEGYNTSERFKQIIKEWKKETEETAVYLG